MTMTFIGVVNKALKIEQRKCLARKEDNNGKHQAQNSQPVSKTPKQGVKQCETTSKLSDNETEKIWKTHKWISPILYLPKCLNHDH